MLSCFTDSWQEQANVNTPGLAPPPSFPPHMLLLMPRQGVVMAVGYQLLCWLQ